MSRQQARDIRRICETFDLVYQGIQKDDTGSIDLEPLVLFAETTCATTLALPISKFTPNAVIAKLEWSHARERVRP